MLSTGEILDIIASLDRERLSRLAWRHSSPSTDAAVGVDAGTGEIAVLTGPAGGPLPTAPGVVILRHCSAWRRMETEAALRVPSDVPPSPEVVEEEAVRDGAARGLYWGYIEEQLDALERRSARGRRQPPNRDGSSLSARPVGGGG